MDGFNPYLAWLDIGPHEHPIADHRLLGLRADETDSGVIAAAAAAVLAHLEQFSAGAQAELGRRLMAEVAAARDRLLHGGSPAGSPAWAERQIKAPPPVPFASTSMGTPAPKIKMPPPPASISAASRAPASPSVSAPDAGFQVPAFRPALQSGSGVSLPPAFAAAPNEPSSAPEVTPVGVPLGTVAPSSIATYAPPPNAPPAPPPPASPGPVNEGTWIPTQRGGRVGKSAAGAAQQNEMSPDLQTINAHLIRRASRQKKNYVWAMLAVGGVCLALLLIVLAIVAKNS